MCWHEGVRIKTVTIKPDGDTKCSILRRNPLSNVRIDYSDALRANRLMRSHVRICFAGLVAQRIHSTNSYRKHHDDADREAAMDILLRLTGSLKEIEALAITIRNEAYSVLNHQPGRWRAVTALAEALMERRTIPGIEAGTIIERAIASK